MDAKKRASAAARASEAAQSEAAQSAAAQRASRTEKKSMVVIVILVKAIAVIR